MTTADLALSSRQLLAIFETLRCGDLVEGQTPIVIDSETSVEEACATLAENSILSAPVYDTATKSFTGFFDYSDLIAYTLTVLHRKNRRVSDQTIVEGQVSSHEELSRVPSDFDGDSIEVKEIVSRALKSEPIPVRLVSDLSRKNPFYAVVPESTLLSAVDVFARGIHRVAVVSGDGHLKGILSQSTVLRAVFPGVKSSIPVFSKTLHELDLGNLNNPLISIPSNRPVIDALELMHNHGVSSICITNPSSGNLIGNVSMTDMKYIFRVRKFSSLWDSCLSFIQQVRLRAGIEAGGADSFPYFDVLLEHTLGHAIGKLIATKTHRLWVVESSGSKGEPSAAFPCKPIGIISLTDIFALFSSIVA